MDRMKSRLPQKVEFSHFLEKFPVIDLPVVLGEDSIHAFSKENDPLPLLMIDQYLKDGDPEPGDDLIEYIACFKLPDTHDIHAVVYWKAELMNYQYILATFQQNGQLIDRRVLAGTFSDGETLTTSVATIDPDWIIYVATGQVAGSREMLGYDALRSKIGNLELLADGKIIDSD